ncbi:MAG: hypothetical protein PWR01_4783 [Clostridiales bacterium]|nr:hypothetical protein [Clostridiales bacterium]MDN5283710.1 hypothetical protein [Candidatus Ozemobacter sp.]
MFKIIVSLAGIQVLQAVVQILKIKFVTVLMGAEGLGVISLINQFVQLVIQVSTLALPWVATRFMAVGFSHGPEEFSQQVKLFFRGIWRLSFVGMLLSFYLLFNYDYVLDPNLQKFKLLGLISLSLVLPTSIKGFILSVFTTAGKFRFAAITSFANVFVVTFMVIFGAWSHGIVGFFVGQAIAEYLTMLYCLICLKRDLAIFPFSGEIKVFTELKKLKGSLELIIYGCVLCWLYPASQTAVRYSLLLNGGEKQVGLYQAIHGLVLYVSMALTQATTLYIDPILKRDISFDEKFAVAGKCLRNISFLMGTAMILIGVFPEFFLKTFYSAELLPGKEFLFAFLCIEFINVISAVYMPMLIGEGFYRTHFLLGIIVHGMVALISVYAVPVYGVWGVVYAYVFSAFFTMALLFSRLIMRFGIFLGKREIVSPILIFSVLAAASAWVSSIPTQDKFIPESLNSRLLIILGYFLLCRALMTKDELVSARFFVMRFFKKS